MKKFWIVLGIILGFLAVLVILNFTVFSLKEVKLSFHNQTTKFENQTVQNQIIEDADFQKTSVFFLDKQSFVNKLEKQNPYLKVVNLEINFPNSLTIHCVEREPLFVLVSNEKLITYDADMKVLDVQNETVFLSLQSNPILLENFNSLKMAGDFEDFESSEVLKNVFTAFSQNNKTKSDMKSLIKNMSIISQASVINYQNTPTLVWTDFLGNEIQIKDAHQKLSEKIQAYFAVQEKMTLSVNSTIIVYENLSGKIVAQQLVA